jgi:predicted house-cleaning noncanonical NTP pyrophosphatase (MazG superfamily)
MKVYKKLVRDKIPAIIKKNGDSARVHVASRAEYWKKLLEKLEEEIREFRKESNADELADILEVIYAIRDFKKISPAGLEKIRKEKAKKRGAFRKRIILDFTD